MQHPYIRRVSFSLIPSRLFLPHPIASLSLSSRRISFSLIPSHLLTAFKWHMRHFLSPPAAFDCDIGPTSAQGISCGPHMILCMLCKTPCSYLWGLFCVISAPISPKSYICSRHSRPRRGVHSPCITPTDADVRLVMGPLWT